jgi:hypothetical protein
LTHTDPFGSDKQGSSYMKKMMLAFAVVAALSSGVMAADGAAEGAKDKPKHAQMTPEQREAMITKRLETIKAKDEALYKELIALKEKDPEAFKAKMKELSKQDHQKGPGKGKAKADNK